MIKSVSLIVLLWISFPFQVCLAGNTVLGPSCDLSVFGGKSKSEFLAFDKSLRTALKNNDAATIASLVEYPLTLNYGDGTSISLNNPATVQARYREAFPDNVRDAVLQQDSSKYWCNYEGFMYGNGAVWVTVVNEGKTQQYRISSINIENNESVSGTIKGSKIDFICDTQTHHIVIDEKNNEGAIRYRAWGKNHKLQENPDMVIDKGTDEIEGSGICAYDNWKFVNGNTEYDVMGMGCTDGSEPSGSKGQLQIFEKGKLIQTQWCY